MYTNTIHIYYHIIYIQGVPKNVIIGKVSTPKFNALGQNYTMDMTWKHLIVLSVGKGRVQKIKMEI